MNSLTRTVTALSAAGTLLAAGRGSLAEEDMPRPALKVEVRAVVQDARAVEVVEEEAEAVAVMARVVNPVQQFTQQLRPYVAAEQRFLAAACRPSPEAGKAIARDLEEALTAAARAVAEWQVKAQQPQPIPVMAPDPRKLIRDALEKAAAAHLTPEQVALYRKERAQREADRKRSAVLNLVAKLDNVLFLTSDQREKLAAALAGAWDDSWAASADQSTFDDQYFPPVPDPVVTPVLTGPQKKVWEGLVKVQRGGGGVMDGLVIDEAELGDHDGVVIEVQEDEAVEVPGGIPGRP